MHSEYNFFAILLLTVLAYGASLYAVRSGRLSLAGHRRIWNHVLLFAFGVTGIFGMFMTLLIDSKVRIGFYPALLFYHVELGVVLALVGGAHLLWHAGYYLAGRRQEGRGK